MRRIRHRYITFYDDNEILNGLFKSWLPHLNPDDYTDLEKNDMINMYGFMGYVFNALCRLQENGIEIYMNY